MARTNDGPNRSTSMPIADATIRDARMASSAESRLDFRKTSLAFAPRVIAVHDESPVATKTIYRRAASQNQRSAGLLLGATEFIEQCDIVKEELLELGTS
jgi:hypothetical protein